MKKVIAIVLLALFCFINNGCNTQKDQVIFCQDLLRFNVVGDYKMIQYRINVPFLCKHADHSIQYQGSDNDAFDKIITETPVWYDNENEKKGQVYGVAEGYILGFVGIVFNISDLEDGDCLKVNSFDFKVDDEIVEVELDEDLIYTHLKGMQEERPFVPINSIIMNYHGCGLTGKMGMQFEYKVTEDNVQIEGFEFGKYISIEKASVKINGGKAIDFREAFPVKLNKDDKLAVVIDKISYDDNGGYADYNTNYILYWHRDGEEVKGDSNYIGLLGIGSPTEFTSYIDSKCIE